MNKYYIMQLIREWNHGKPTYYTAFIYGRVGKTATIVVKEVGHDLEDAVVAFTKQFKSKTGQDFFNGDNFHVLRKGLKGKYAELLMTDPRSLGYTPIPGGDSLHHQAQALLRDATKAYVKKARVDSGMGEDDE